MIGMDQFWQYILAKIMRRIIASVVIIESFQQLISRKDIDTHRSQRCIWIIRHGNRLFRLFFKLRDAKVFIDTHDTKV